MSSHDSLTTWLDRLKAGHSEAAGQLWQHYVEQLVRLARRKLARTPRRAADEEDVVLSAFNGFLQGVEEGRFVELNDRDDLWQILVMLTERKAIALRRRERALKRGAGRVRGESVFADGEDAQSYNHVGLDQTPGREPTPDLAAEISSALRQQMDRLGDDTLRRIAAGKLEGYTNRELAQKLGISLRAVERKLSIIRSKWREEAEDESV